MGKVILGFSISSDGFINDRKSSVEALYTELLDWRETELGKGCQHHRGGEQIQLERIKVVELPGGRTHLRFRFVR